MKETTQLKVTYFRRDRPDRHAETRRLIAEGPLVIDLAQAGSFTIMRTPGQDRELIVGFLFSEGIIDEIDDILTLEECPEAPGLVRVRVTEPQRRNVQRNLVVNPSCGLCGRADLQNLLDELGTAEDQTKVSIDVLYNLPGKVSAEQRLFHETGASHAAALFDADGTIHAVREDLGRHNAVDKVLGHALLAGTKTAGMGMLLSGRTSLEMIIKAARARIGLVAAVGAASAMAIEAAAKLKITLCGFVRGKEVVVYSHDWRIAESRSLPPAPNAHTP